MQLSGRSPRCLLASLGALTVVGLGGWTTPAGAACGAGASPYDAATVFVGKVLENRRGYTRFEVMAVAKGPDLAKEVWVLTGTPQGLAQVVLGGDASGTDDARLDEQQTYLVGTDAGFVADACSTQADPSGKVVSATPPRGPVASGSTGLEPPLSAGSVYLTGAGVLGVLVALVMVVVRDRRLG